jgi:hypothetical protein
MTRRSSGPTPERGARKRPQPTDAFGGQWLQARIDVIRDSLALLTTRSKLEAWLANPATVRSLKDLQFSPSHRETYAQLMGEIEAAREWAIDDRPEGDTAP